MKYFAYGSNMSILRLQSRVPSAKRIGTFQLKEHDLRFHKVSEDGSGKCNAFYTGNLEDVIIGSLFEIDHQEKAFLDKVEGLGVGYDEKHVVVVNQHNEQHTAYTYVATHIDDEMVPYSWYLNHVIVGAKESQVPVNYLTKICQVYAVDDYDAARQAKETAIYR